MSTRRRALAAAAGLVAVGFVPFGGAGAPSAATLLSGMVRARSSAQAIGAAYLAMAPKEAEPARLLRALVADPATARALARTPVDRPELERAVATAIRADFLARRTVELDGWVLAITEARLCGLCRMVRPLDRGLGS